MAILKQYNKLVALLQQAADDGKKVSTIMDDIIVMCSTKAKAGGSVCIKNAAGEPVAILCYYYKRWMPLFGEAAVPFNIKKSNKNTGLNTMCIDGDKLWNKQNNAYKKAITTGWMERMEQEGKTMAEFPAAKAELRIAKEQIEETTLGFATRDELIGYMIDNSIEFVDSEPTGEAAE